MRCLVFEIGLPLFDIPQRPGSYVPSGHPAQAPRHCVTNSTRHLTHAPTAPMPCPSTPKKRGRPPKPDGEGLGRSTLRMRAWRAKQLPKKPPFAVSAPQADPLMSQIQQLRTPGRKPLPADMISKQGLRTRRDRARRAEKMKQRAKAEKLAARLVRELSSTGNDGPSGFAVPGLPAPPPEDELRELVCPVCCDDETGPDGRLLNPPDARMPCCKQLLHQSCASRWHAQACNAWVYAPVRADDDRDLQYLKRIETCHQCVMCRARCESARLWRV